LTVKGALPCTVSFCRRCASILASVKSFTATKLMSALVSMAARYSSLPILPNPLIATFIAILNHLYLECQFKRVFS
jgi:hypothetical protein